MCDFSLMHLQSRPAKVADKLVVKDFGTGTVGFASADEAEKDARDCTAVCVLPGTEIAFDKPIVQRVYSMWASGKTYEHSVGIFRQVEKESACTHHDALELPDGVIVKLTTLKDGQFASVLQLPAAPKTEQEAKEQTRLEVVA